MRHVSFYILILLLLSGCSTSSPSVNEYTLFTPQAPTSQKTPLFSKTLTVASAKAIPSLCGKNLIYLRENGETGSYLYSRWSDAPATLMQRSLMQSLNENALFVSLSPASSLAQSDWVLESDLDAFYHRFSKGSSEGYIDITYRLIDAHSKVSIASKRFVITAPAPSMDALGGVEALKHAQSELNHQSIEWLKTLTKETK